MLDVDEPQPCVRDSKQERKFFAQKLNHGSAPLAQFQIRRSTFDDCTRLLDFRHGALQRMAV